MAVDGVSCPARRCAAELSPRVADLHYRCVYAEASSRLVTSRSPLSQPQGDGAQGRARVRGVTLLWCTSTP
jgi:hypothetical protein